MFRQSRTGKYLLIKSSGDNALVGANDDARKSRCGTLNARNDGAIGGTLTARDGARDQSKHTHTHKKFWLFANGKLKTMASQQWTMSHIVFCSFEYFWGFFFVFFLLQEV